MKIKRRQIDVITQVWPNVSPLIQKLYVARGLNYEDSQIELNVLLPYHDLLNIEKAAQRLADAVSQQQHILIIGDFDADGATASALAVSALRAMGSKKVNFLVPNRFLYGYGLTVGIVEQASVLNPNLIMTVDNGITNVDGVARAKQLGIDVLITDHHLAGEKLPEADIIVNPNQPYDKFKSKAIAGVGVVFYVMSALRRELESRDWFSSHNLPIPNMAQFLDLVALGTVADVVPLDKNNRVMVKHGLMRMQKGLARPGIQALILASGRQAHRLKASDLGFFLGPRLNAAGRLDDMSLGINCLLAPDLVSALPLAQELDVLNTERKQIESVMQGQALESIQEIHGMYQDKHCIPAAISLYRESWHQGVIGILAGRIKDKFKKPTIIFAEGESGELKGSARSISGLNIRDVLATIDRKNPGLILKFGGHAMAAGLAIRAVDFSKFSEAFVTEVTLLDVVLESEILSDGELESKDFSLATIQSIIEAGPWGQQFPEPVFDNTFRVVEQRIVGKNHLKLSLQVLGKEQFLDAIIFNIDNEVWPNHRVKYIHAVYSLDINEYQGRQKLQLLVQQFEARDENMLIEPA